VKRKDRRNVSTLGVLALALFLAPAFAAGVKAPGGFVEKAPDSTIRPKLSVSEIQAFLPTERSAFTFPAPYNTRGARITVPADCRGRDCVNPVGYSYWRRMNNHVHSSVILIFLTLADHGGPTLFSYDKNSEKVTKVGPLFPASNSHRRETGEIWYWSRRQPATIYLTEGARLLRYDVLRKQYETVFDVAGRADLFGTGRMSLWQIHSSDDDRTHSATVMDGATYRRLGCLIYQEEVGKASFFPPTGDFKECHVDKSGRWLLTFDTTAHGGIGINVIIDLQTGNRATVLDQHPGGVLGHYDVGFGHVVGYDRWSKDPGTFRLWRFGSAPSAPYPWGPGTRTFHSVRWSHQVPDHVSWGNAQPDSVVPISKQYVCGSGATSGAVHEANEIICWRLDSSLDVLVVAPVMTNLDAPGGGDQYSKFPKGNLDVTGQYYLWTANMGGNRLEAFIVRVPSHLLAAGTSREGASSPAGMSAPPASAVPIR
jgi:hypothetical protein